MSTSGILASNRVSSSARAYISGEADHSSSDGTVLVRPGDTVRLANGDIYVYGGSVAATLDLT